MPDCRYAEFTATAAVRKDDWVWMNPDGTVTPMSRSDISDALDTHPRCATCKANGFHSYVRPDWFSRLWHAMRCH